MNCKSYILFLAVCCLMLVNQAIGQSSTADKEKSDWYIQQLFTIADVDANSYLTIPEILKMGKNLGYFLDERNFNRSDSDGNGSLSLDEVKFRMGQALVERMERDEQELKGLEVKYPYFADAKLKYFKRHPDLTVKLVNNRVWMEENEEMVGKILMDKAWLDKFPQVVKALHHNFQWLTENPSLAKRFYKLKQAKITQPPFRPWRERHSAYIKSHPGIEKEEIKIDFPYWPGKAPAPDPGRPIAKKASPSPAIRVESIDSILIKHASMKASYEAEITKLKKQLARRDSVSALVDARMEMRMETERTDIESLKKSLEALQKHARAMDIERRLAMVVEDSLLATNIRNQKRIQWLEKEVNEKNMMVETLTGPGKLEAKDSALYELKKLKAEQASLQREKQDLLLRLGKMEAEKSSMLADAEERKDVSDSFRKEHLLQQQKITRLEQELLDNQTAHKKELKLLENRLADMSSMETTSSSLDSLYAENERLNQKANFLLEENQKLGIAHDQYVKENKELLDSLASYKSFAFASEKTLSTEANQFKQQVIALELELERNTEESNKREKYLVAERDSLISVLSSDDGKIKNLEVKLEDLSKWEAVAKSERSKKENYSVMLDRWRSEKNAYQLRIDELSYDKGKLKEQLELSIEMASQKEEILEKRLKSTIKTNQQLTNKNKRMKERLKQRNVIENENIDQMLAELESTKSKVAQLEQVNNALVKQLRHNEDFLRIHLEENTALKQRLNRELAEVSKHKSRNDTIRRTLRETSRVSWTDSLNTYRERIFAMRQRFIIQDALYEKDLISAKMQIDSLEEEVASLQTIMVQRSDLSGIDQRRIDRINLKDRQLQNYESALVERASLIERKEALIQEKLDQLAVKEQKYMELKEWEKNLFLLEQRIKNMPGYKEVSTSRRKIKGKP